MLGKGATTEMHIDLVANCLYVVYTIPMARNKEDDSEHNNDNDDDDDDDEEEEEDDNDNEEDDMTEKQKE